MSHDCDREGCEGITRRTHADCLRSGVPFTITDPEVLAHLAAVLRTGQRKSA